MLYRCSKLFRNLLAYAIGYYVEFTNCSKHAPRPFLLASHRTLVGHLTSNNLFSVIDFIASFILLNASVWSVFQSSLLCDFKLLFESNGRSGSLRVARFGVNIMRWCMHPMNERSCLSVFGVSNLTIDSHFLLVGIIPFGCILNPSQTKFVFANSHFCSFIARFSLSRRFRILFISFSWSFREPLVIMSISSKNANFECMPSSVLSIVFLKCCGHVC